MRFEVFVLQRLRRIDAASLKASPYQDECLIQIDGVFSPVPPLPIAGEAERVNDAENLAAFRTPAALLKFIGRNARAAQEFLHLISCYVVLAVKNAQELARNWFSIRRRRGDYQYRATSSFLRCSHSRTAALYCSAFFDQKAKRIAHRKSC